MGFFNQQGEPIETVLLRHLGRQEFQLAETFEYHRGGRSFTVEAADLPHTDLASVPWFLRWLIPRYGRHLLPALLHDWQYSTGVVSRDEADELLLESLEVTGVPRVRREVMVAAVTLFTRLRTPVRAAGIVAWLILFLAGTFAVLNTLLAWWTPDWWAPWIGIAAALAPVLAATLWGRNARQGLWAGYAMVLVAPSSALILVTQAIYWLVEQGFPGDGEPIGTDEL